MADFPRVIGASWVEVAPINGARTWALDTEDELDEGESDMWDD